MKCPNCGAPVEQGDRFCGECGTDLTKVAAVSSQDSTELESSETLHSHNENEPKHSNQQPSFDKEKFNQQANEIKHEGTSFFSQLFKSHDSVVAGTKPFSLPFIGIVSAVFLILTLIILAIFVPSEVNYIGYGVTKSGIVTKSFFGILLFLVISYALLVGVTRLVIKDNISFVKILSDFVFINTFSFIFFILGLLLVKGEVYSIGSFLFLLGTFIFFASAIYLITKYSSYHTLRIPAFFGIILYIFVQLIVLSVYGEMLQNTFEDIFGSMLEDIFNDGGGF
ncbi:zinc ribbon domain-containing protein [Staphylococcus simulans]